MVRYIVERKVEGDVFPEPFARTIKQLAAPRTLGTAKIWLGIDEIQPHNSSNGHVHEGQEEVFFFLSGKGRVRVNEEEIEVGPGYCVLCPMGSFHQVINHKDAILRFVAVVAPPFTPEEFGSSHGQTRKESGNAKIPNHACHSSKGGQKMVKYITEKEADGDVFPKPYARTIKPLAAPWTLGTKHLWLATDEIEPHNASDPHIHKDQEEVLFFLSGKGRVRVDKEEIDVGPGYCVLFPIGSVHEVINDQDTILRFIAAVSPPFPAPRKKNDGAKKKA
jgi:mannose-6-phosphate isomerase-like protein (cupin superfamily)